LQLVLAAISISCFHFWILFTGIIILAVTLLGSFEFVVRSATFTILLYYGITNLSAIKQPAKEHIYGRLIPWLGLAGCIVMSLSLPLSVIGSGLILLATGFLLRRIPRIN
jgi:APA family basic amino acid/polyamine antiporter